MIVANDRDESDPSVDREATKIVRDIVFATPPKSIETIKAATDFTESAIIEERVRRRAYEMWEADGRPPGDGQEYWTRAERELLAEIAGRSSTSE